MKFDIIFEDKTGIVIKMEKAPKTINDSLHETTVAVVNDIRNEIVTKMENTPKAPWSYRRTKSGKRHHPSLPGYPPAKDSGNLVASIVPDDRWPEVEVGSILTDPPYPEYLEKGTSRMAARPVWEPTLDEMHDRIENDLMEAIKKGL